MGFGFRLGPQASQVALPSADVFQLLLQGRYPSSNTRGSSRSSTTKESDPIKGLPGEVSSYNNMLNSIESRYDAKKQAVYNKAIDMPNGMEWLRNEGMTELQGARAEYMRDKGQTQSLVGSIEKNLTSFYDTTKELDKELTDDSFMYNKIGKKIGTYGQWKDATMNSGIGRNESGGFTMGTIQSHTPPDVDALRDTWKGIVTNMGKDNLTSKSVLIKSRSDGTQYLEEKEGLYIDGEIIPYDQNIEQYGAAYEQLMLEVSSDNKLRRAYNMMHNNYVDMVTANETGKSDLSEEKIRDKASEDFHTKFQTGKIAPYIDRLGNLTITDLDASGKKAGGDDFKFDNAKISEFENIALGRSESFPGQERIGNPYMEIVTNPKLSDESKKIAYDKRMEYEGYTNAYFPMLFDALANEVKTPGAYQQRITALSNAVGENPQGQKVLTTFNDFIIPKLESLNLDNLAPDDRAAMINNIQESALGMLVIEDIEGFLTKPESELRKEYKSFKDSYSIDRMTGGETKKILGFDEWKSQKAFLNIGVGVKGLEAFGVKQKLVNAKTTQVYTFTDSMNATTLHYQNVLDSHTQPMIGGHYQDLSGTETIKPIVYKVDYAVQGMPYMNKATGKEDYGLGLSTMLAYPKEEWDKVMLKITFDGETKMMSLKKIYKDDRLKRELGLSEVEQMVIAGRNKNVKDVRRNNITAAGFKLLPAYDNGKDDIPNIGVVKNLILIPGGIEWDINRDVNNVRSDDQGLHDPAGTIKAINKIAQMNSKVAEMNQASLSKVQFGTSK